MPKVLTVLLAVITLIFTLSSDAQAQRYSGDNARPAQAERSFQNRASQRRILQQRHLRGPQARQLSLRAPARPGFLNGPIGSPVATHGALRTVGSKIIGDHGRPVSLAGPSFFWSNTGWGQEPFYNAGAVQTFARDWKAGIVRASIGAEGGGSVIDDPTANMARAETVIDAAIANGLYVIVDFHTHQAERNVPDAKSFFTYLATKYGNTPNIIYEIYNEPLNTTDWASVIKPYSEDLIRTIRAIDPDNLIVVGTQTWSQDVDKAAFDRITISDNLVYALHFYAATHKNRLRERARYAIAKGLPLMVTEWGTVTYSGDGAVDRASSEFWLDFIRANDITHLMWAASSKDEGASMFTARASKTGPWPDTDLTVNGRYARDIIAGWDTRPR